MIKVSASEFSRNFGQYREAAQREAVAVTNHDRVTGYFLSSVEYEEYRELKSRQRKVYSISNMPDELFEEIMNSEMDPKHDHLNSLME